MSERYSRSGAARLRWSADGLLLAISAIWGSTFVIVKDGTEGFSVTAFLVLRFVIASAALGPFVLIPMARARRWPRWQDLRWGIGAGLLFAAGYVFQSFSLRLIDSGRAGFLTGLYVVLVPAMAMLILRYAPTTRLFVATVLALGGVVLLGYAPGGELVGDLMAIGCALCFAGQILLVDQTPIGSDWRFVALVQAIVVAVVCGGLIPILASLEGCVPDGNAFCAALSSFADPLPTTIPASSLAAAAFTGVFATALALPGQVWAQRSIPASDAALIFAMEAPFAVLFGILLGAEQITPTAVLGCALIFGGMILATLGKNEKRSRDQVADLN